MLDTYRSCDGWGLYRATHNVIRGLASARKDRLSLVGLYDQQETLRTYSNSDPHCKLIFFKSACHQFSLLILFLRTRFSVN